PQLDHFALAWMEFREIRERIMKRYNLGQAFAGNHHGFVQWYGLSLPAPFGSLAGPGVIDEHVAHGFRGDSEKMSAIPALLERITGQAEIRFVEEGGGL